MTSKRKNEPKRTFVSAHELSRTQRERLLSRAIVLGIAAALLLVVGLLSYGYYREVLHKGNEPIAVVNGQPIPLAMYAKLRGWRAYQIDEAIYQTQAYIGSITAEQQKPASPTPAGAVVPSAGEEGASPGQGTPVPTPDPQDSLRQQMEQQLSQLQLQRDSIDSQLLEELIQGELIRQEAAKRGLSVSADEIDAEVARQFAPPPPVAAEPSATPRPGTDQTAGSPKAGEPATPGPASEPSSAPQPVGTAQPAVQPSVTPGPAKTAEPAQATPPAGAVATAEATKPAEPTQPAPTPDPAQANDKLREYLSRANLLTVDEYRQWIVGPMLLEQKVRGAIGAEVPNEAEQVHARHILVATEDEANKVRDRLNTGESFDKVAAEASLDTANKDKGGDLGWFPRGVMDPEFEKAAFELEPGKLSAPVKTSYGYHVIRVEEHSASRPLSDEQLQTAKAKAFQDWLAQQGSSGPSTVQRLETADKIQWAERYAAGLMKSATR